jgi:hypothetical protein
MTVKIKRFEKEETEMNWNQRLGYIDCFSWVFNG